ncbi:MAG: GNAT family N-acetyltransferase [Gemmataceae bacterium]|nr:GNAT family N-acetyltransferase [Gemmataceae bacterium]MDW8266088.1 GNAT family N-acetyltransferase [Gemmataceae bacterium]
MADAVVEIVGPEDLPVIVQLYNQIFRPPRNEESFLRRYRGRYNVLQMIARIQDRPVGFFLGFELKPTVFFAWFYGVLPEYRRQGIASQLMDAVHSWARQNDYESIRFECHNQHRPMLHLAIALEYDIVGIRWDPDRGDNLVIFEKVLTG